jgi:hypothetical protein
MSTWRGQRAKERQRSRIVVSVDEGAGAKGKRRGDPDGTVQVRRRTSRRRRGALVVSALIVVAIVAAAFAGFYIWYQSNEKSPTYSLALLADAARRNDRQTVDQLVDIDQVMQSLVPQVVNKVTGGVPLPAATPTPQANATRRGGTRANAQTNSQQTSPSTLNAQGATAAQAPLAVRRYVSENAGVIIPGARDAVRDALAQTIRQGVASHADSYPFFVTATAARFAADKIDVQGDVATLSFKSNARPVTLTMQRTGAGERWRIVAVQSDELASRIADNLSRGLPALGR